MHITTPHTYVHTTPHHEAKLVSVISVATHTSRVYKLNIEYCYPIYVLRTYCTRTKVCVWFACARQPKWEERQGKRCVILSLCRGGWYFGIVSYFQYVHITKRLTLSTLGSRNIEKNDLSWQRSLLCVFVCLLLIKVSHVSWIRIKLIRQVNIQRQEYIREVLEGIESIWMYSHVLGDSRSWSDREEQRTLNIYL